MVLRLLFKLAVSLIAGVTLVNAAAMSLGTLRPPHPALEGFVQGCEGQPQPCWRGIVPGQTTEKEAHLKLHLEERHPWGSGSYTTSFTLHDVPFVCSVTVRVIRQVITDLGLRYCADSQLLVGDVAAYLGSLPFATLGSVRSQSYTGGIRHRYTDRSLNERAVIVTIRQVCDSLYLTCILP